MGWKGAEERLCDKKRVLEDKIKCSRVEFNKES